MAPSASSRPARSFDLWVTDNVEALAISIAMALILKFFVVEAYQIPTGSMQPTILGDAGAGIHDRILADKTVTLFRDPRRWEVMIFRFPLDERRLYVKRIVGLPGETLEVLGGDVWIDGALARKPDHVNDSVMKSVHGSEEMDIGRWFGAEGEVALNRGAAIFGAAGGSLSLKQDIHDRYLDGYESSWGIRPATLPTGQHRVPDLDLRARLTPEAGAEQLTVSIDSGTELTRFVLGVGEGSTSYVEILAKGSDTPRRFETETPRSLRVGDSVELLARSVDRRMLLRVDGETWLSADDDLSGPRPPTPPRAQLQISTDGPLKLDQVHVRRDIFYLPHSGLPVAATPRWEIPDGHYFGLGDNTQSSHDGRSWQTKSYELTDGRRITGFWFDNPRAPDRNPRFLPGRRVSFADIHGDAIEFGATEIVSESLAAAPFIPQENLLGKASVVFWPVLNPFRWKLVR